MLEHVHAPPRRGPRVASSCSSTCGTTSYENRSNVIEVYIRYLRDKLDRERRSKQFEAPAIGCEHERRAQHHHGADREQRDAQKSLGRALSLRRVPFRARLTLGFAAVMIVLFGGLALLLHERFAASLDQGLDRSLHTHAADLATLVHGQRARSQRCPRPAIRSRRSSTRRTGRVRDATPGHVAPLLNRAQLRLAATSSLTINDGDDARLRAQSVDTRPPAVLVVGSSLSQRNRALTTLSELLFIGGPLMLILTCVAGYGLAARALAPVERMSVRAARISGAPTGERLPIPEADDELHRLGVTINAMLSRLEHALARERSFVADAGHELRTPSGRRHPRRARPEAASSAPRSSPTPSCHPRRSR